MVLQFFCSKIGDKEVGFHIRCSRQHFYLPAISAARLAFQQPKEESNPSIYHVRPYSAISLGGRKPHPKPFLSGSSFACRAAC